MDIDPPVINYNRLQEALDYYKPVWVKYVETPWLVSHRALFITTPNKATVYPVGARKGDPFYLVASGEQSFLQLMLCGVLPPGRYVTLTPCFRYESQYGELHRPYFMKVELIDTSNTNADSLKDIIRLAEAFFSKYTAYRTVAVKHDDPLAVSPMFDITAFGTHIELGSYGIREHEEIGRWVYGTGCAEPRLSAALKRISIQPKARCDDENS